MSLCNIIRVVRSVPEVRTVKIECSVHFYRRPCLEWLLTSLLYHKMDRHLSKSDFCLPITSSSNLNSGLNLRVKWFCYGLYCTMGWHFSLNSHVHTSYPLLKVSQTKKRVQIFLLFPEKQGRKLNRNFCFKKWAGNAHNYWPLICF